MKSKKDGTRGGVGGGGVDLRNVVTPLRRWRRGEVWWVHLRDVVVPLEPLSAGCSGRA